jgi:hypothetical protein
MAVTSCGLLGSKTTEVTVELLNSPQKVPISVMMPEGKFVYKQKICFKGFSSYPILINGAYTLKNNIDTCFTGDWYSSTDTLRIEPLDAGANGKLSVKYHFYY